MKAKKASERGRFKVGKSTSSFSTSGMAGERSAWRISLARNSQVPRVHFMWRTRKARMSSGKSSKQVTSSANWPRQPCSRRRSA